MSPHGVATTNAAALAAAPATQPMPMRTRGFTTSARLVIAVASVAATNPAWTATVSHAVWEADNSKASASDGVTAVAENHSDMPSSSATASAPSMRQAAAESAPEPAGRAGSMLRPAPARRPSRGPTRWSASTSR